MTLQEIINKAGNNAEDKGFYDLFNQLKNILMECKNNNNEKMISELLNFVNNQNICTNLMLIVSELGEAVEHLRSGRLANISTWKETFEEELADVLIRLADLCFHYDIDIEKFIKLKMKYNEDRQILHGKKF